MFLTLLFAQQAIKKLFLDPNEHTNISIYFPCNSNFTSQSSCQNQQGDVKERFSGFTSNFA